MAIKKPSTSTIQLRCTDEQKDLIERQAALEGVSITAYIKGLVEKDLLYKQPKYRFTFYFRHSGLATSAYELSGEDFEELKRKAILEVNKDPFPIGILVTRELFEYSPADKKHIGLGPLNVYSAYTDDDMMSATEMVALISSLSPNGITYPVITKVGTDTKTELMDTLDIANEYAYTKWNNLSREEKLSTTIYVEGGFHCKDFTVGDVIKKESHEELKVAHFTSESKVIDIHNIKECDYMLWDKVIDYASLSEEEYRKAFDNTADFEKMFNNEYAKYLIVIV